MGRFMRWLEKDVRRRQVIFESAPDLVSADELQPEAMFPLLNMTSGRAEGALVITRSRMLILSGEHLHRTTVDLTDIASLSANDYQLEVVLVSGTKLLIWSPPEASERPADFERALNTHVARAKASATTGLSSVADELSKLVELREQGVLDADDWIRASDFYLGKPEDERDRSARELRQIFELHRSGVLSASEYRMRSGTSSLKRRDQSQLSASPRSLPEPAGQWSCRYVRALKSLDLVPDLDQWMSWEWARATG